MFLLVYNESVTTPIQFAQFLQTKWRRQILFLISISKFRLFQPRTLAVPIGDYVIAEATNFHQAPFIYKKIKFSSCSAGRVCKTLISRHFYKTEHLHVGINLSLWGVDNISDYIAWNIIIWWTIRVLEGDGSEICSKGLQKTRRKHIFCVPVSRSKFESCTSS